MKKTHADQLAVFGGEPQFTDKLHVGQPNIGDRARLMERINRILDARWLTNNGQTVQELERRLEDFLSVRHVIAVCNATVGLEVAARALGMDREVIVPSLTFVATAHALQWQQIKPVFCDVDPRTHNLDPARVRELITPQTSGILGVHLWGRPCDVEALQAIADEHAIPLLYDAAHAFGATHAGRRVGNFGNAEVFSFHGTKFINSFEGGAIATNDDALAAKIRLMINFGFASYDNVVHIGTNGKMNEVCAAMGLTSLESIDHFIDVNRRNAAAYARRLADIPGMALCRYDETEQSNFQYLVVEYTPPANGPSRDDLIRVLWAENAMVRKYFWPGCHRMEPYRTLDPDAGQRLPHTEAIADRLLILPTGTGVSVAQIDELCDLLALAVAHGSVVSARLERP